MTEISFPPPKRTLLLRVMPSGGAAAESSSGKTPLMEKFLWFLCLAIVARLTVGSRRRSLEDFQAVDGFAMFQVAIVGLSLLAVLLSGRMGQTLRRVRGTPIGAVLLFHLFGAMSACWSPSFDYSLYRAVEVASQILAILVALSYCPSVFLAERRVLVAVALSLFLGMLSVVRSRGITLDIQSWHTNQFTVPAMLIFSYAFGEIVSGGRKERRIFYVFAAIGLFGVALGTSTASSISALVGGAVALLLTRQRSKALVFFLIILSFLAIGGVSVMKSYVFYGKSEKDIGNLHGRRFIWEGYMKEFLANPVFGNGFAISARVSTHYKTTNAHNSALSVLLGTGLAGMAIVGAAGLLCVKGLLSAIRRGVPGAVGCTAAIAAGALNSMAVALFGETYMMSSFSFFCMLCLASYFVIPGKAGEGREVRIVLRPKSAGAPPLHSNGLPRA